MNDRWQKSLEAAVAAYDTPMPWDRGTQRQEMLARRKRKLQREILRSNLQQQLA